MFTIDFGSFWDLRNYLHINHRVWDAAGGHILRTLKGHTDDVSSVAVSADGSKIISASFDQTIK